MRPIDDRMDELEKREEMYWKQRSRQDWLKHGAEFEDEKQITEVFVNYFQELFAKYSQVEPEPVLDKVESVVNERHYNDLAAPFTVEEVRTTLFQMHLTKAPGTDGMSAVFFQKFWNVVGMDVVDKVLDILNNNGDICTINQTHIVLIPKKKDCESTVDYRPISLCNVMYKIVTKVLAKRLKIVLPFIIHESQSEFVLGRLITDSILVAYECFHYLRKMKTGKKGYLSLKLDMSKANDRVE
uniref:Reverse transcriptase domain-containing protein n=1 Tax=Chenopodium quinoa TaxID=63459 RepID=A0A803MQW4_CHEQI